MLFPTFEGLTSISVFSEEAFVLFGPKSIQLTQFSHNVFELSELCSLSVNLDFNSFFVINSSSKSEVQLFVQVEREIITG